MELKSAVQQVIGINKKTRAQFWGNIQLGDQLQFSMELNAPGRNGNSLYASYIKVDNLTQGTSDSSKSQTQVASMLDNFELMEVTQA